MAVIGPFPPDLSIFGGKIREWAEYCFESTVLEERTHWVSAANSVSSARNSVSSLWHTNNRPKGTHWVRSLELSEPPKTHWVRCLKPYCPKPYSARLEVKCWQITWPQPAKHVPLDSSWTFFLNQETTEQSKHVNIWRINVGCNFFQKNPFNSGAGNGCANFMDTWKKCLLSAGKPPVHKIPRFRGWGGILGLGVRGEVPILFLWARGFFWFFAYNWKLPAYPPFRNHYAIMGSQHPSPNVKTLCNFETQIWLEIIASRDAKSACWKVRGRHVERYSLASLGQILVRKDHITWWVFPAEINPSKFFCVMNTPSFAPSSQKWHFWNILTPWQNGHRANRFLEACYKTVRERRATAKLCNRPKIIPK